MTRPTDAATTPAEARAAYRRGLARPTAGVARGHTQANLVVLPSAEAEDFRRFAESNPKACPLLEVTEPGATESGLARGSDLRTDLPLYRVWRDGEPAADAKDVGEAWAEHDDLVAFLIGCSFTFEFPLLDAGVPVRHIEAGRNVPMYETSLDCVPAGRFRGRLVVSMRGIPAELVDTAVEVSGRYPDVHGAPVHIGDPGALGIGDLGSPDHGDAPVLREGDVPVFWACGVTPQAALAASRPRFAITHAPGHMFVTDMRDEDYRVAAPEAERHDGR